MKKNIILFSTLLLLAFSSCTDYLTVNSESSFGEDLVFMDKEDINRVLSSVYVAVLHNDIYGNQFLQTLALNSDVEFTATSSSIKNVNGNDFRHFDGTAFGGQANNAWTAAYRGIERANLLINGIQNSSIEIDDELKQIMGEAKALRAMLFHDLVVYFGDIPFSTEPAYNWPSLNLPIVERNEILSTLIEDLCEIAPQMQYARDLLDGVERASREFCYALIARIALTRGGYALYPDTGNPAATGSMKRQTDYLKYYEIAKLYADSVIISGTHSLVKPFRDVFIDECNYIVANDDDPIFELPFLKNSSGTGGNVGYVHGPAGRSSSDGVTVHPWGPSNGGLRLNAFYRFSFDRSDLRLEYTVGMWSHDADGLAVILDDYSTYCNKWSKYWTIQGNALGNGSTGNTGINFPYMRYADVLLMYAEAVNELENGVTGANGEKAQDALRQVRNRAFVPALRQEKVEQYIQTASASKESFFNAIVNERKWEFGGENLRWKDLVRWNLYSKVVYDSFKDYFLVGNMMADIHYDGDEEFGFLPTSMYWRQIGNPGNRDIYPNTNSAFRLVEFYKNDAENINCLYEYSGSHPGGQWIAKTMYNWTTNDGSTPAFQCLYSFRGYIRGGEGSNWQSFNRDNLPPVRYILPIPRNVIQLSQGAYQNYYGY